MMAQGAPLRIGVAGLGFGRFLVNDFASMSSAKVVAVADPSGRKLPVPLDEYCRHFGVAHYTNGEQMLTEADLDAVAICSPPKTHRRLVELAAARQVHVLLEKPMAYSLEDCDAMIGLADRSGIVLALEHPMRNLPVVQRARKLLENGLGTPLLASADYVIGAMPDQHWVWDAGGPLNENTCHIIDTLRYLIGDVTEVSGLAANLAGNGAPVPDCSAFSLRFSNGALAAVTGGAVGLHNGHFGLRVNVYCSRGQLELTGRFHTFHRLRWVDPEGSEHELDSGAPPLKPGDVEPYGVFGLHVACVADFIDAVVKRRAPNASGLDGRATVVVSRALLESAAQGKPIQINRSAPPAVPDSEGALNRSGLLKGKMS